jgi:hypothetical protein
MLKDCTDWLPPRWHSGVIILSPPESASPPAPADQDDVPEAVTARAPKRRSRRR